MGRKEMELNEWVELNRIDFVSALLGNKDCPWQNLFTEKDVSS